MLRSALIVVVGFLGTTEGRTDDAVQKERAKMKGTWRIVSFEINGKRQLTDEQLEKFQLIIDAEGTFTARLDGNLVNESTTRIDPTKMPKTLDYSFTKGPVKGLTSLAIYELKDDNLTISAGEPGKNRPTELSSKASTLVVHKRKKVSTTQAQQGGPKIN
jgi:uncharacterized protein (TIGR03067 family)